MSDTPAETDLVRVVLADANVLYSRVLRDYLLYAADQEIITIAWSSQILAEVTEHLKRNVAGLRPGSRRAVDTRDEPGLPPCRGRTGRGALARAGGRGAP